MLKFYFLQIKVIVKRPRLEHTYIHIQSFLLQKIYAPFTQFTTNYHTITFVFLRQRTLYLKTRGNYYNGMCFGHYIGKTLRKGKLEI